MRPSSVFRQPCVAISAHSAASDRERGRGRRRDHRATASGTAFSGRPILRTLQGESELAPGHVVSFPRGRRGAHTLANHSDEPVQYLMISTKVMPEVAEYPEDGTVRMLTRGRFDPP